MNKEVKNYVDSVMSKKALDYINSIDYELFKTNVLHSAGNLHESVNQLYDEDSKLRYQYHLDLVVGVARLGMLYVPELSVPEVRIITFAAAFHDAIEDTRTSYNDLLKIASKFSSMSKNERAAAVEVVYAVTNEKGRNRKERADDRYYEGIRTTPYAPFVKICDRIANMSFASSQGSGFMRDAYRAEMDKFISSIRCEEERWPFSIPEFLLTTLTSFN